MKPTTLIALDWCSRCFPEQVWDRPMRTLRLIEEAVELGQAFNIPKEKILLLVESVYSRPRGQVETEIGQVALTHTVLCATLSRDPEDFLLDELRRVLKKPAADYTKRNQEKIDMGLHLKPPGTI